MSGLKCLELELLTGLRFGVGIIPGTIDGKG